MPELILHSTTSNILRFVLKHATTGQGLTGLTNASSGLIIGTVTDAEAATTTYTVAASNVETITTLGTYAAPSANKCRFKEVDATNHRGLYEFQFANGRFSVANARRLIISVTGATNLLDADYQIVLVQFNPYDAVRLGLTALPNAAAEAAGGLYTRGSGAGQINQANNGQIDANTARVSGTTQTARDLGASVLLSTGTGTGQLDFTSGVVKSNLVSILGTALTETAGQIAAAFKKFFDKASPTGTINSLPDAVAGAANGLLIAGSNAATTVNITGNLTGNVTGSVGSVTATVTANATQIEGVTLSSKAGDNFNVFFQNAGADTTKVVDNVGGGGGGTQDWTATELSQIRYRLGIDGTTNTPSATPTLALQSTLTGTPAATADAVWDEVASAHQTNYTFGRTVGDPTDGATNDLVSIWKFLNAYNAHPTPTAQDVADVKAVVDTLDTRTALIKQTTDALPDSGTLSTLQTSVTNTPTSLLATQMTEGYATDGVTPTVAQMFYMLWSALSQFDITGATLTCRKLDGTTQSMQFTLNDTIAPTSRVRSS